jgi:septal ring factor EnvC (AmiA/AmiB activator)
LTDNVFYKKEELEKYQGNVEYFEKLDKALEDDILDIREIEELIEATKDSKIINKLFKNVKKIITKNKDISDKIAKSEVSERALKTNLNYISNKLDQLLGEFPLLRGEMEQLNDKYNVDYDPNDFNINDNVEDMELKDLEKLYTARFSMLEILIETIVRKNLLTTEQEEKIISISKKRDADK